MKHGHMADLLNQPAARAPGQLSGEAFAVLLVFGEADFDQYARPQCGVQGRDEGRGETGAAKVQDWLEQLRPSLEVAQPRAGGWGGRIHGV